MAYRRNQHLLYLEHRGEPQAEKKASRGTPTQTTNHLKPREELRRFCSPDIWDHLRPKYLKTPLRPNVWRNNTKLEHNPFFSNGLARAHNDRINVWNTSPQTSVKFRRTTNVEFTSNPSVTPKYPQRPQQQQNDD